MEECAVAHGLTGHMPWLPMKTMMEPMISTKFAIMQKVPPTEATLATFFMPREDRNVTNTMKQQPSKASV
jgi:hypothetical protein